MSALSVSRLQVLERELPMRILHAEQAESVARKKLLALVARRELGEPCADAEIATARAEAAAAHQRAQDLRELRAALPRMIAETMACSSVHRPSRSASDKAADRDAYFRALAALQNTRFRGMDADEVKKRGRAVLQLAKRAGKTPHAKEALADIAEHNHDARWLGEVI